MNITDNAGMMQMMLALVKKALTKAKLQDGPVIINNWDLDAIYMTIDGADYHIRTWDIRETAETVRVRWSLFYHKEGDSGCTQILSSITSSFKKTDK